MLIDIKRLYWLILFAPISLFAQNQGVVFSKVLSWEKVLRQARDENRYIFVDCYATWCGPCKQMDRNVYSNDSVGAFMNASFISVKMQMDSTVHDSKEVRDWHQTALQFEDQFSIFIYPTFLFFEPDGTVVHEGIGELSSGNFLKLAKEAINPQSQYFGMLRKYKNGNLDYASMPELIKKAAHLYQDSVANSIATDYILHYLQDLPDRKLWTKENITFISSYQKAMPPKCPLFRRYYQNSKIIDSIMDDSRYTDRLINYVIYESIISPAVTLALAGHYEPNWRHLKKSIDQNYSDLYAEKNIVLGKVFFYRSAKQWKKYAKYLVIRFKEAGIINYPASAGTFSNLNNLAFEIFKYSDNHKELLMALAWVDRALAMEQSVQPSPFALDTKANLLYKLGKKDAAIALEERCVKLAPTSREILDNFEKMKIGVPTWKM